jgi:hypothetical protein
VIVKAAERLSLNVTGLRLDALVNAPDMPNQNGYPYEADQEIQGLEWTFLQTFA